MKSVLSALEPILLGNSSPRPEQILRAKRRYQSGAGLIEASTESGVNARTLASALAQLYRLPMQPHIDCDAINRGLLANMPVRYARAHRLLPLSSNGRELVVAIADPSNYVALDDLGMLFQMPVRPIVTPCDVLDKAINRIAEEIAAPGIRSRIVNLDQAHLEDAARRLSQEPAESVDHAAGSVKALVRGLIREAINEGASDLRLEPREAELRARYSVRGLSYDLMSAPKCFEAAIIACLKTMACMNPTESNASRQGYISIRLARRIAGVVVSIIPCAAGEAVTLGLDGHGLGLAGSRKSSTSANGTSPFDIDGKWPCEFPRCPRCGEAAAVKNALFCRACGGRLLALPQFDEGLSVDANAATPPDRSRSAARNAWRLY